MSSVVHVGIHSSQSPGNVRRDLLKSLQVREVNHKFHYESYKQAQKWLLLHQKYSPSRLDPDCLAIYHDSFAAAAASITSEVVELVGLGCGGGQKDARFLQLLAPKANHLAYIPIDVSLALVLAAQNESFAAISASQCHPLVCDLASAEDLPDVINSTTGRESVRVFTFFGMIPNFEPTSIVPKLASLVRPGDWLLFSANLAPGPDYREGVERILPGYDNALTRDWLNTFLFDLGVEPNAGSTRFTIESGEKNLLRIVARFHFDRPSTLFLDGESFSFRPEDSIRLFFSYRYTPDRVIRVLAEHGFSVSGQWVTRSEEEGVFLCQKRGLA